MNSVLLATAAALVFSSGGAFAATGNSTTTSMAAPTGSPGYAAPRSSVVPGLPAQTREAQQDNGRPRKAPTRAWRHRCRGRKIRSPAYPSHAPTQVKPETA